MHAGHRARTRLEHTTDQSGDLFARLQAAQTRRIGRGNIAHQIIGVVTDRFDALHIVSGRILSQFILADISANDAVATTRLELFDKWRKALAVKTETVDDRGVFIEPEQPRLRVARLRQRRDSTRLNKTKTQLQHRRHHIGVLVKASGQTNRVLELQIPHPRRQHWRRTRSRVSGKAELQGANRDAMRGFRTKQAQHRHRRTHNQTTHSNTPLTNSSK